MSRMRRSLRTYVWAVIAIGAGGLAGSFAAAPPRLSTRSLTVTLLLTSLIALAYAAPLTVGAKRRVIPDTALHLLAIALLPPPLSAAAGAGGAMLGNTYLRRPAFNALFNAAQVAVSLRIAAAVYRALAPSANGDSLVLAALLPAGLALYLVSTLAVDGATAIQRGRFQLRGWLSAHAASLETHALLVAIGIALAPAVALAPWLACVAAAPALVLGWMQQARLRFETELVEIAEELADTVEPRAGQRPDHSRDVAALVDAVARRCKMSDADSRSLTLAVRVHHLHNVVRPDDLLAETGLQRGERRALRRDHPEAVAAYATAVFGLRRVAETLRFHHERFDGRGEPFGLAGKDIPLGSRIFVACEAYAALRAPGEHRPALAAPRALLIAHAGAGTLWDPDVIAALSSVVQDEAAAAGTGADRAVAGARTAAQGGGA